MREIFVYRNTKNHVSDLAMSNCFVRRKPF